MMENYELKAGDLIPIKGYQDYKLRNDRMDNFEKVIPRAQLLMVYNTFVVFTGILAGKGILEGLEKIIKN
jgi:hypothetical protein